jgi:HD-like signal output (HDOD) protein
LSGETDPSTVYRCIQNAHQYISKPCDAEHVVSTVDRIAKLKELLADPELAGLVSSMSSLPSIPEQYEKIMQELQSEDMSLKRIGEIIESDVAMTAKILQLANSAFFGMARHVASAAEAVMLLGVDVIRTLVLTAGVFRTFDNQKDGALDLHSIWSRSLRVAMLAKRLMSAESDNKLLSDYAYMGGMMYDVGKLVLASNLPEKYVQTVEMAKSQSRPDWDVEVEVFGHSHTEVGAYLAALWGLPTPIVESAAFHHQPRNGRPVEIMPFVAVHIAHCLVAEADGDDDACVDHELISSLKCVGGMESWRALLPDNPDANGGNSRV